MRDLFTKLAAEGSPGGRGPLSPCSLHNVRTVLHKGLQQAAAEGVVARNVVALVPPPPRTALDEDEGEPEHWTAEQAGQFLDCVDTATVEGLVIEQRTRKGKTYRYERHVSPEPMLRAVFYLMAYTGMKRGEACGLRWENVNLERGTVSVRNTRVMVGGQPAQSKWKTQCGRRTLPLDPTVVEVLKVWRVEQARQRLRYGAAWEDDAGHVFTHEMRFTRPVRYGVPVRPDWVTSKFKQYRRGAELPALRLHGLRHTVAKMAYENGEDSRTIGDLLGHADQSVTDRTYVHTVERVQAAAAARVAGAITSARSGAPADYLEHRWNTERPSARRTVGGLFA